MFKFDSLVLFRTLVELKLIIELDILFSLCSFIFQTNFSLSRTAQLSYSFLVK
jgi:hypothetical protein